jgi:guanosine-3',5'-bis(diphosphate) 3'-pyrophosphohydrolase
MYNFCLPFGMSENEILEKVKEYADKAHGNQRRRYSDDPYIVHPVRVMEIVRDYVSNVPVLAAALLHDVLEDTDKTVDDLRTFLTSLMSEKHAEQTVAYVIELTDEFIKKNYPQMNRKSRRFKEAERLADASAEAQTIKYADVLDNAADISDNDPDFATVYLRESMHLIKQLEKGNPLLRSRAMEAVQDRLKTHFRNTNITSL